MTDRTQAYPKGALDEAGMEIRDVLAAHVMGAILLNGTAAADIANELDANRMMRATDQARSLAEVAYVVADAMMTERTG